MMDRSHARQRPADTPERFRSLFHLHPHAIYGVDLDGNFTDVNPAAARISGYAPEQLLRMSFADIVVAEDLARTQAAFVTAQGQHTPRVKFRIRRPDASIVHLDVTSIPMVLHDVVVGMYGIAEDITSRQRTALELEASRKLIVAADEAKNTFVARISHDLRTPLTSMLAVTELLADTPMSIDQQQLVATLQRSGNRLLALVQDVLDLSRYRNQSVGLDTQPCNLRDAMVEAVATFEPRAVKKGIELTLVVGEDVPAVVEDHPHWTNQVLANLLDNAVKFTDCGAVRLTVSTATTEDGVPSLLYQVRDTGIGIAADRRDDVFKSFTQADDTIHARYGGTGLGLTIVRELVTLLGGSVWVMSKPGRGSTFSVLAPIRPLS